MQDVVEKFMRSANVIRHNKGKIALIGLALAFGPGIYADWEKQHAAAQLAEDKKSVDLEASSAGMVIAGAWRGCANIGILNNMEGCAAYQGQLIQEMVAPKVAAVAIEQRSNYYVKCERFYPHEYCAKLLARAVQISYAQGERKND